MCLRCQSPCEIPLKGIEDLPTNYFIAGMILSASVSDKVDLNNVRCELCEENEATVKCKQCDQFQCDSCQRIHLRAKSSSQHQFATIDEALQGGRVIIYPQDSSLPEAPSI